MRLIAVLTLLASPPAPRQRRRPGPSPTRRRPPRRTTAPPVDALPQRHRADGRATPPPRSARPRQRRAVDADPLVGKPAPDFTATAQDGSSVHIAALAGKPRRRLLLPEGRDARLHQGGVLVPRRVEGPREDRRGARRRVGRLARFAQGVRRALEAAVPPRERSGRRHRQEVRRARSRAATSARPSSSAPTATCARSTARWTSRCTRSRCSPISRRRHEQRPSRPRRRRAAARPRRPSPSGSDSARGWTSTRATSAASRRARASPASSPRCTRARRSSSRAAQRRRSPTRRRPSAPRARSASIDPVWIAGGPCARPRRSEGCSRNATIARCPRAA